MWIDNLNFDKEAYELVEKANKAGGTLLDLAGVLFFDSAVAQRAVVATCCADLNQIKSRLQRIRHTNYYIAGDQAHFISLLEGLNSSTTAENRHVKQDDLLKLVIQYPTLNSTVFSKAGLTWPLLYQCLDRARLQSDRHRKIEEFAAKAEENTIVPKQDVDPRNSTLSRYGTELVSRASTFDPVIGREDIISDIINILSKKKKRNPCLVGYPGVGKTALVEEIAKRIAEGRVPPSLLGSKIWCISLGSLVAGSKLRGQFEEKIERLLAELQSDAEAILFFDEIHLAVGAGRAEGSVMDVANLLKPVLARGDVRCIGATTYSEFKDNIRKDGAFARRFIVVDVPEPTLNEAMNMLAGLKREYERFHSVKIPHEVVEHAVYSSLPLRKAGGRYLPDCAIDLLDEACVRCNNDDRRIVLKTDVKVKQVESTVLSKL